MIFTFLPISYDYDYVFYDYHYFHLLVMIMISFFYNYHYYFHLLVQRCTLQLLHGILCEARPRWTPGTFVIVIINSSFSVKDINVKWHFENDDQVVQR